MAFTEKETAYCLEAFEQNPPLSWESLSQWCGFYATQNRFLSYGIAKKALHRALSSNGDEEEEEEEEQEPDDDQWGEAFPYFSESVVSLEDRFNLAHRIVGGTQRRCREL